MGKRTTRFAVLLCLVAALFALPAFAQAIPADPSITGTITASATGSALSSITVTVYTYDTVTDEWDDFVASKVTGANGAYSFTLANNDDYKVVASDKAYKYYSGSSYPTLGDGDSIVLSFALNLDTDGPNLDWDYFGNTGGLSDENWATTDVKLELWANDGLAVTNLQYKVNGSAYKIQVPATHSSYESTVTTITAEGVNTVVLSATDANANVSKRTFFVYIDKTAPVTTYEAASATGTTIKLVAADSASGVASTYWRLGSTGDFKPGNVASVPATGVGQLQFFSVDKAGNEEAVKTLAVQSRAVLTRPKASTSKPRAGKKFYVKGAVTGRAAAAGKVYAYKLVKGKYVYSTKKSFTASSTGSYKVSFKLKKGTYKFKAFYGANTATSSNPLASSAFSKKSVVKK